jgi:4-hydroxybenzoate polyprenyltransferase
MDAVHASLAKKVRAYVQIGRPSDALRPLLFILLGVALQLQHIPFNRQLATLLASFFFLSLAIVAYNDIQDIRIDRKTNTRRPLVQGTLSVREVKSFMYVCTLCSFALILLSSSIAIAAWILIALLGFLYSYPKIRLSHHVLFAPLTLLLCTIIIPTLLGALSTQQSIHTAVYIYTLFFTLLFISIGSYKDFKDEKSDKKDGKRTLLSYMNRRRLTQANIIASALLCAAFSLYTHSILISVFSLMLIVTQLLLFTHKQQKRIIQVIWIEANLFVLALILQTSLLLAK